jgi:long-subunit acyl-CoA synthetase (AMP-forming)
MLCCAGDMTGGRWGPFWDKLVFSKIRERVGGEVKYMTTGGGLADVSYFGLVCFQEFTNYIYEYQNHILYDIELGTSKSKTKKLITSSGKSSATSSGKLLYSKIRERVGGEVHDNR